MGLPVEWYYKVDLRDKKYIKILDILCNIKTFIV